MEERELGISPQSGLVEKASADLSMAGRLTSEALNNKLPSEQRSFLEGLQENLQGAKPWLDEIPRRKSLTSTLELALAVSLITSYAPKVGGHVIASNGEDSCATATEVASTGSEKKELTDYNISYDGVSMKPTYVGFSEPIVVDGEWISPPENTYLLTSEFEVHGELGNLDGWKDEKDINKTIHIKDGNGEIIPWKYSNLDAENSWLRLTFVVPYDITQVEMAFPDDQETIIDMTPQLTPFLDK